MQYSYLIELKFLKRDDTTTKVESLIEEAETQLRKYASLMKRYLPVPEIPVYVCWLQFTEAGSRRLTRI